MRFPNWVECPPDQPADVRAAKRLSYILRRAALETSPNGTLGAFADYCGVERSFLSRCIALGTFAGGTAVKIERAVNDANLITAVALTYPLDIIVTL